MTQIDSAKFIDILRENYVENLLYIDKHNIYGKMSENQTIELFVSEDVLIDAVSDGKGKCCVTVIPRRKDADLTYAFEFISEKYDNGYITVNMNKLSSENAKSCRELFENHYEYMTTLRDFAAECDICVEEPHSNIRLLDENDKEVFVSMENEREQYRPPLEVLFDTFVGCGNGWILAYFENGGIVGYLSFLNMFDDAYDVDFVYVSPGRRRQGISNKLACAYVHEVCKLHGYPAWGNARNIASEKAARFAGLRKINEGYCYRTKNDGDNRKT